MERIHKVNEAISVVGLSLSLMLQKYLDFRSLPIPPFWSWVLPRHGKEGLDPLTYK